MRVVRFVFFLVFTLALLVSMNRKWGNLPPLGKFFDPFYGFWQNAESTQMEVSRELFLDGLNSKVVVTYDSMLIPHIKAEHEEDAYFAQGFITAQFRLWQMEMQTMAAAGRLSEIVGPSTLDFDREKRRRGMVMGAEKFVEALKEDPKIEAIAHAYTDGVNAYIASLSESRLPLEYKLLDYYPEKWDLLKFGLILKYMASDLSDWDSDLAYTNALHTFGRDTFELLYPDMLPFQDPVVNKPGKWSFEPVEVVTPTVEFPEVLSEKLTVDSPDPDNGSNNWAVAGKKTKSGFPILCNDPHLALNLPSIWMAYHLQAPGLNVMGVSIPGVPGIISGFNDSISWGITNARRDVVDWYKIRFKDGTKEEYWLDNQWKKTERVIEKIKVKGQNTFYDTVYYTQWGPVVYESAFKTEKEETNFAFQWMAHQKSNELKTFYQLNRGKNYEDYREALSHFSCPAQNFVFASTAGDIAMTVQGKFPVKWPEQGKFAMDGSRSEMGWQSYIPTEHLVADKNPERGFTSSANQHPADSTYPYYDFDASFEYYRNRRINRVLDSLSDISVNDMKVLQNDNYNLFAAEALPILLPYLESSALGEGEKEFLEKLRKWDYFNHPQSEGATVFEAFWNELYQLTWDELRERKFYLKSPNKTVTLYLMSNSPDLRFYDIQSTEKTENLSDLLNFAFKEACESLVKWKNKKSTDGLSWTDYKATSAVHLLRIPALSEYGLSNGGNRSIVNATSSRHGPSWRMVVEMEPGNIKAWGIYPGGQSGNPGSKYYNNFLHDWVEGKYFQVNLNRQPSAMITLSFNPLSK